MSKMQPIITVEGLSKVYRVGSGRDGGYRTLRESIVEGVTGSWQKARRSLLGFRSAEKSPNASNGHSGLVGHCDDFRALDDVSLEVEEGQVVGIVGRNGAGKSTLLKVLSRVTEPTEGHITIHGRIGSLLEVGTGFHPELTGRENVYLNGAILGMSRREITRLFDEIVAFAEIEKFLDTPVKRYSSGMYVRLAFAVASHLEPEVLVVDEVLAVGDATFQKKCLGRMNKVSRDGRTILFVSHNMSSIKSLCTRAILLEEGRIALDGTVDEVVNRYLSGGTKTVRTGIIPDDIERISDHPGEARCRSARLSDLDGKELSQFYFGQPFRVSFSCDVFKEIPEGHFEISVSTLDGIHVTHSTTLDGGKPPIRLTPGRYEVSAEFDSVLMPRDYVIDLGIHHATGTTADFVPRSLDFTVLPVAEHGNDHYLWKYVRGLMRAPACWDVATTSFSSGESGTSATAGSVIASNAGQQAGCHPLPIGGVQ